MKNDGLSSPWWKPGMKLFSDVSTWILVPILVAVIVGKKLDAYYNTKPWIFLVFAFVGFLITCIGIIKVMRNYTKKLKDLENHDKVEPCQNESWKK